MTPSEPAVPVPAPIPEPTPIARVGPLLTADAVTESPREPDPVELMPEDPPPLPLPSMRELSEAIIVFEYTVCTEDEHNTDEIGMVENRRTNLCRARVRCQ